MTVKQAIYDSTVNSGLSYAYGTNTQIYINNTWDDLSEHKFFIDSSNTKIGNISPNISNYLQT
ncbi:hypothetical protein ACH24_04815 [Francisella persica ATCC VR-331]|uniref:Uncharacterized protein n=1 Tax=Francisella persica ATCC VR-331 TaxID=1086726 RepID=A0AAC8VE55_9GAMM|nr:hypothetical protein [Francisella persica]ALB01956.1 hypothetical protein ACH24_04815 [Francisella persica ATCC VR-331]ANH77210.1 hypothetical protein FSC845_00930 [Francisella persica ATCC VR-331]